MNNLSQNLINKFRQHRTTAIFLFVMTFVVIVLYLGGWSWIKHTDTYRIFIFWCAEILGNSCVLFLKWIGYKAIYSPETSLLQVTGGTSLVLFSRLGFLNIIIAIGIVLIYPKKMWQSLLILLISIFLLYFLTVVKRSVYVIYPDFLDRIIRDMGITFLQRCILFLLLIYKVELHPFLKSIKTKINELLSHKVHLTFYTIIFIVLSSSLFIRFIDAYLFMGNFLPDEFFTSLILYISNGILNLLGYDAYYVGKYLFLEKYWVMLGDACLGVGVMTVFIALMLIVKSKFLNKLIYLVLGLIVLFVMNGIRIAMLLLYLYINKGSYTLNMEVHDMSNYFFYLVVFFLFSGYLFWFQDVDLSVFKKKTHRDRDI